MRAVFCLFVDYRCLSTEEMLKKLFKKKPKSKGHSLQQEPQVHLPAPRSRRGTKSPLRSTSCRRHKVQRFNFEPFFRTPLGGGHVG